MPVVKSKPLKNKNLLVSSVIAAYNEELHLAECIEYLLKQSYSNAEIIIVENGESKDKTYQIAKSYEKKFPGKVRAFSLPGKQKGPGNAWNFGAKKAKGEIIHIVGADLRYGKNYIKEGIKPIIRGNSVGLVHKEEKCNNVHNLWARAFFYRRNSEHKPGLSRVFSLIKKDYLIKRPFNSALGYADDQTIYMTEKTEFPTYNLEVYHTNPASFADTWGHSRWVGRSINNPLKTILLIPLFPFYALYKTYNHMKEDFYIPFIFFLPIYYSIRYWAYATEAFRKLFGRRF